MKCHKDGSVYEDFQYHFVNIIENLNGFILRMHKSNNNIQRSKVTTTIVVTILCGNDMINVFRVKKKKNKKRRQLALLCVMKVCN